MDEINQKFKEYVTSTAFNFNLSKRMIEWLFYLRYCHKNPPKNKRQWEQQAYCLPKDTTTATSSALMERGLIEMKYTKEFPYENKCKHIVISKVGLKVCELLEFAGFIDKFAKPRKKKNA